MRTREGLQGLMTSPGTTTADLLPAITMATARPLSRLFVAAALLVAIAVLTAVALTSVVLAERTEVARLTGADITAERLLSDLTDAETGQRGFLLTGQDSYLRPYQAALARLQTELSRLHGAVVPGGVMVAPVAALERLVPEKLAELARTIDLRRAGDLAAALSIVETGQGTAIMDAIRAEVAELDRRATLAAAASDAAVGRWLWIGTAAALAFLTAGVALGFRLVREREFTKLALSLGEVNIRAALDAIPQMVWSARADGYHDYHNRRWYEFTGTNKERAAGEGWFRQLHADDRDKALRDWRESLASGAPYAIECRLRAADGSYAWILGRALPVRDPGTGAVARWYGTCTDIDELVTARGALSDALDAKEVLLQEVNHRVKNSLQLVSSLLTLQAANVRGVDSKEVLADARARLSVVARLHQRLYQGGTHDSVDLFSYLQELCVDSLAAVQRENRTELVFEAAEAGAGAALQALWPIDKAVPIALIVSELVTNAVKHAFPDGGGTLRVLMGRDGAELRILIEDNGPGLPDGFDAADAGGVGMRVVTALVRQLGGRIQSGPGRSGTGAAFSVVVPGEEK